MKVELEKTFPMPGSADVAWEFLQDIEAVAGCMPGAKITERLPDGGYKGTVTVRVGPATMSFRGEVEVRDVDAAAHSLRLLGKGTDSTGTSGASMDLAARIEAVADGSSNLVGKSEVSMSGKAAAFGGRMMNSVADQILKQFADNFATQVAALARAARGARTPPRRQRRRCGRDVATAPAPPPASGRPRAERPRTHVGRVQGLAARPLSQETCVNAPSQRMNEVVDLQRQLQGAGYIAERPLAAALLLMLDLGRPLLLEGDAGVGKTEVAKALATVRGAKLIRLQCYEGLDVHAAMYEWNYQRQLLAIKLLEHDERPVALKEQDIFSERYLLKRPLLEAISCAEPPVLLIDEVDRADEAFEAYLLELLSDFQMSIPELGTRARRVAPAGGHHLQRHARAVRRAAPPLPLSVHRLSGFREGARDRRDAGAGSGGRSSRGNWSSSCRASAAWTCRRSRASRRRSTGRRRCCGSAFPRSTTTGRSASSKRSRARQDARRPRRLHPGGRRPHRGRMLIVAPSPADHPGTALRTRLTGFAGFLRANGYGVGGGDSTRVLEAAGQVGILDGEILRWSLKALLCGRGDEWRRFDALFDAYFLPPNKKAFAEGRAARTGPPEAAGASGDASQHAAHCQPQVTDAASDDDDRAERHGASREESLASTDFRDLDRADQVRDIEALMRRFARRLKHLQLRREARFERWPPSRPAGHDTPERRERRHAVPAGLEGPPPRASAPRPAARRQPVDEPVQLLLPAPRARALRGARRRALLHLPHAHHRRRAKRCATRIRGDRRNACTCWPPDGPAARASANACRISTAATRRGSCIRARR